MNNDDHLNKTLNRLSHIYNLPHILKESSSVLNSTTYQDIYQSLILPTHAINNSNKYDNSDANNEFDYLDNKLDVDENMTENNKHSENSTILIGHCIVNNGGILLNNLSKIPSYQWGFKHEDESLENNGNTSFNHDDTIISSNTNTSNNTNNTSNILTGLSEYRGTTISALPGNVIVNSSGGLNARMNRLPIMNKHSIKLISNYDLDNNLKINTNDDRIILQGGKERNLMNGLPYYKAELIEKQIRNMNIVKKSDFKASNANTSWFSNNLNKTIDDIEYLHGEAIINQFITNKRTIRNYQWDLYWYDQMNGNYINNNSNNNTVNENYQTLSDYKLIEKLKFDKLKNLQIEKNSINTSLISLNNQKQLKRDQYINQITESGAFFDKNKLSDTLQDCEDLLIEYVYTTDEGEKENDTKVTDKDLKPLFDIYGEELINTQIKLMKRANKIMESEDEIIITNEELAEYKNKNNINLPEADNIKHSVNEQTESNKSLIHQTRFSNNKEFIQDNEFIIERELPINDSKLIEIENKLLNKSKNKKRECSSKIVKIKRTPNPNAIGFSNIRRRKPSFM